MMDIQTSLTSSLFREDTLSSLTDIKFTSLDITRYWNATVGTTDHNKTVARIRDEFDSPDDAVDYLELSYAAGKGATNTTTGCILNRLQVIRLFSRAGGPTGKTVRRMTERYFERLEARVLEQQAELVRKDAIIAMLKYEFGESSLASAFVFGMQQEAQDRSFQFIDKPKLLLANLTGPMTACFNNGVDFYSEHKHKRRTGESVWDFYTRIKTEQALALL